MTDLATRSAAARKGARVRAVLYGHRPSRRELELLAFLAVSPGARQAAMMRHLGISSLGSVGNYLRRLECKGCVEIGEDGNRDVTDRGRQVLAHMKVPPTGRAA